MDRWIFKENSLDLLRLVAACQVMILHSFEFTMGKFTENLFFDLLRLFPGVPIFFFISGYLISRSYESTPTILTYWKNRILRIFPALIICVFINILMIWSTDYFSTSQPSIFQLLTLFMAKISIFQFYNPDYIRNFGDGVLNGSLWTICVELQFYIIVPILYKIIRIFGKNTNLLLLVLIAIFICANRLLYITENEYSTSVIWKLYRVSFAPWVYMFLSGVLVQRNFKFFAGLVMKLKMLPLIVIYISFAYIGLQNGLNFDNSVSPIVFFPLAIVIFRIAYSMVKSTKRLLRGNDISYGIYIWHMPFVNQLTYLTSSNETIYQVLLVILCTILVACISWFGMEKKILRLKNFSLHYLKV